MKTLLEVLQAGTDYLARQGCDEARATMQHLLAHVLHCNRTALYSQFDRPPWKKRSWHPCANC